MLSGLVSYIIAPMYTASLSYSMLNSVRCAEGCPGYGDSWVNPVALSDFCHAGSSSFPSMVIGLCTLLAINSRFATCAYTCCCHTNNAVNQIVYLNKQLKQQIALVMKTLQVKIKPMFF